MAVAADHIERTQIVVEPRDSVPRDDGPAAGAAPRTPAGSTPPTEKIPSMGAEHLSECRVDGIEIKVIDPIAAPVFHRRDNRAMLQEPQAPSLIAHASTLVTECVVDAGPGTLIRRSRPRGFSPGVAGTRPGVAGSTARGAR